MKTTILSFIAATALSLICSCGNPDKSGSSATGMESSELSDTCRTEVTKAYIKGREEARCILDSCETENEIRDKLLQTNARIHILRSKGGDSMADDFIRGLRDELRESGDTLAATLFPS